MVAFVGPALRLPVPPQPVANIMATIATAKSKYRFIGASKFSVSGEVSPGINAPGGPSLPNVISASFSATERGGPWIECGAARHGCGDKPHRIRHLRSMVESNIP